MDSSLEVPALSLTQRDRRAGLPSGLFSGRPGAVFASQSAPNVRVPRDFSSVAGRGRRGEVGQPLRERHRAGLLSDGGAGHQETHHGRRLRQQQEGLARKDDSGNAPEMSSPIRLISITAFSSIALSTGSETTRPMRHQARGYVSCPPASFSDGVSLFCGRPRQLTAAGDPGPRREQPSGGGLCAIGSQPMRVGWTVLVRLGRNKAETSRHTLA